MGDTLGTLKSAVGLGSGIDIQGLVEQLVAAEGQFKTSSLDKQEEKALVKITSFGNLKSSLTSFNTTLKTLKDTTQFEAKSTSITNDAAAAEGDVFFTASATASAQKSSYQIEVRQLAQASKLSTPEFVDSSFVIGTGTLNITVGEGQSNSSIKSYTITDGSMTSIRDTINAQANATGVRAQIITTDSGARLEIFTTETGLKNNLGISVVDSDGNNTDNSGLSQLITANMTVINAAQDAIIRLDGQASDISTSSNTVIDAVPGITLELKKATIGQNHTLNITLDSGTTKAQIEDLVEKYNSFQNLVLDLTKYSPLDPSKNGALFADSTIRNLQNALRSDLTSVVNQSSSKSLSNIGISTDPVTGKLELDSSKLQAAIDSDVTQVGNLFSDSTNGVAVKLSSTVELYSKSGGLIDLRDEQLDADLKVISEDRKKLEKKLSKLEFDLTIKFASLDALLGQLNQLGTNLAGNLAKSEVKPLSFKKT